MLLACTHEPGPNTNETEGPVGPECNSSYTISGTSIEMVGCSAGTFAMGSQDTGDTGIIDENPMHEVELTRAFYIGRTEVTQAQYEDVTSVNPSAFTACDTCPVEQVSWYMAANFARELSAREGLEECYTCNSAATQLWCAPVKSPYECGGYRLPTEAEWEYIALCGDDWLYAGSDEIDRVAWHKDNSEGMSQAVARKAANACGIHDMSGNVFEWTNDWYASDTYSQSPRTDPTGPEEGEERTLRGGGWNASEENLRVKRRFDGSPDNANNRVGFRLARTAP